MCKTIKPTDIDALVYNINDIFSAIMKGELFFEVTHAVLRDDIDNEASLYNNIDYYYGLFYERGYIYIDYLIQKMTVYSLDGNKVNKMLKLVHTLRTYKSHTLNRAKPHDNCIIEEAEAWYFVNAGDIHPEKGDVVAAEIALYNQVREVLNTILACVKSISSDSRKAIISAELLAVKEGSFPDYILEEICASVINKLEIKIDSYSFVKKYGSQIREKLRFMKIETEEAREHILSLCIEDILFSKELTLFPLSSDRIKEAYCIGNGKRLGELRRIAKDIYNENIFLNADELLAELIIKEPIKC